MTLETRIRCLSDTRAALMSGLQNMTRGELAARPIPEKWSILEIVEHLVLAERIVLQGLPEPSALSPRKRSLKNHVLYYVVLFFLKVRIPVQVPSRRMVPRGVQSFDELRILWDENEAWLRSYAATVDSGARKGAVFQHPVAGPVTLAQAVALDHAHFHVHARQIKRLQRLQQQTA